LFPFEPLCSFLRGPTFLGPVQPQRGPFAFCSRPLSPERVCPSCRGRPSFLRQVLPFFDRVALPPFRRFSAEQQFLFPAIDREPTPLLHALLLSIILPHPLLSPLPLPLTSLPHLSLPSPFVSVGNLQERSSPPFSFFFLPDKVNFPAKELPPFLRQKKTRPFRNRTDFLFLFLCDRRPLFCAGTGESLVFPSFLRKRLAFPHFQLSLSPPLLPMDPLFSLLGWVGFLSSFH